ncbi:XylR family transcriptional regulator [Pseudoduganella albidiflava]|uniref:DNA-binding transcriptional regulator n=1 Tax=Pseudoduganella albidiflava TaxID=321983 RepID=A0A411WVV6_9BURK|nr:DNA-binding transcriptional regulator [Pseudoduganella albidiflava]QBI00895.1 DNA-binding transcriptional regulator [Pseudoduganella albidiflava]GGY60469.1 XylR family transcriptional regulator [Pseudoduganella albidiflava]
MLRTHRIALLFNANKIFDREVITGIAGYLASTRTAWDLFLEEDFRLRLAGIDGWQGDGIIADFDDPLVASALASTRVPLVAVGGSYENAADYPAGVPYVATDNFKLVKLAYDHLIEAGLRNIACFSLPAAQENRWAQEREKAYCKLLLRDKLQPEVYRGHATSAQHWSEAVEQQIAWLHSLPKPVGIIAVTDARARQLMQACALAGIEVPEQVAVIGIDNDPLARMLTRIPMSSVIQGAQEMGRTAAHLLDQMLHGVRLPDTRILVPPAGINVLASSKHEAGKHPHVMRARHFIRQYACQGIKTDQVAEYVGISRSSLEAHFRAELGRSVHDEILRLRLEAATGFLARGGCNLADVAVRCGFTSSQYMHSVFKRELGCTPRAWQERQRGAETTGDVPG